jgi:hypothetical protein
MYPACAIVVYAWPKTDPNNSLLPEIVVEFTPTPPTPHLFDTES